VSAYLLHRAGETAIVDSGVAGSEGVIGDALTTAGLGWDSVGHVLITHKHNDHQGSLQALLDSAPDSAWYAGAGDMPSINASRPGSAVGDGDAVFDLQVIETPGHTPGHLCVLEPVSGILVTGDALRGGEGGVVGPNPQFSEDMTSAHDSVRKLAGFDYEVVLLGHGEPLLSGGSDAVGALAASLG
jgi:glyoxylase-like metal-dependent hydrolase (beta-lactamase superfamily II)